MSLASLAADAGGGGSAGGGHGPSGNGAPGGGHGAGGHGGGDPDLKVDDDKMRLLVHRLRESDDRMQGAVRRLEKAGPKGLGTEALDEACAEFQGQWENGIDKIGKATRKVTDGLRSALELHMGNDARVARIFADGKRGGHGGGHGSVHG